MPRCELEPEGRGKLAERGGFELPPIDPLGCLRKSLRDNGGISDPRDIRDIARRIPAHIPAQNGQDGEGHER